MASDPYPPPDQPQRQVQPTPAEEGYMSGAPEVAAPARRPQSAVKFTRAGALWTALFFGFVILIVLLVFIMQNTESTSINFFGWEWSLPVGVAILLAAVSGGLLTIAVGTARILQLRHEAKKNLKGGLR